MIFFWKIFLFYWCSAPKTMGIYCFENDLSKIVEARSQGWNLLTFTSDCWRQQVGSLSSVEWKCFRLQRLLTVDSSPFVFCLRNFQSVFSPIVTTFSFVEKSEIETNWTKFVELSSKKNSIKFITSEHQRFVKGSRNANLEN